MHELKPIAKESIARALSKAERYRLLNEPFQAESICRDVLAIDETNQEALICLILSITDMFATGETEVDDAQQLVERLKGTFDRMYYQGMIQERWARALVGAGYPPESADRWFQMAMRAFEDAQRHATPGNDDAVLRWNACVRMMERIRAEGDDTEDGEDGDMSFDDDVPMR
jgi:hypothetical protein